MFPNPQRSGMFWYHDHALGITRLNVYMGLAGLYLVRDSVRLCCHCLALPCLALPCLALPCLSPLACNALLSQARSSQPLRACMQRETNLMLPSGKYEVPLVLMDREVNLDGSLRCVQPYICWLALKRSYPGLRAVTLTSGLEPSPARRSLSTARYSLSCAWSVGP